MSGDREFVRDAVSRLGQTPPEGTRRRERGFGGLLFFLVAALASVLTGWRRLEPSSLDNGDRFQSQFPAFHIGRGNFLGRTLFGHIDGFADSAGQERLHRGHHFQMGCIVNVT